MSFEGYYQFLCKNGHYMSSDCYTESLEEINNCIYCGELYVWRNLVDVTNGMFCVSWNNENKCCSGMFTCDVDEELQCKKNNGRIDGYVELEVLEEEKCETCKCCGHVKVVEMRRYKIPEDVGRKI
jgi:hypothetical protein